MYARLRPLLFRLEPELAHEWTLAALAWVGRHPGALRLVELAFGEDDAGLSRRVFGLDFPNPVGLAAGFDKNGVALPALAALGFGFVELGSVTALPQPGNPRPRLFRLPQDAAVINRMGFNNEGAEAVAARLARLAERGARPRVPVGVNVGKSRAIPLDEAAADYLRSLERLWPHGDYFAINVSSPNTPGLRELQQRDRLERLLAALQGFAARQARPKPLLLKLSPDLSFAELDRIADLAEGAGVAGLIATNTTTERHALRSAIDEPGGLSGAPLKARSLAVLRHLAQRLEGRLPIVSAGGIDSAQDVLERLRAGAALVQLYTGLLYRGPGLVKALKRGLRAAPEALAQPRAE